MMRTYTSIFFILSVLLMLLPGSMAYSQTDDESYVSLAYGVDFDTDFDNRELDPSSFSNSMTIFAARFLTTIGIDIVQSADVDHQVMTGLDLTRDFGTPRNDFMGELLLNYRLRKRFNGNELTILAGVFSKETMEGDYSRAFFSDSLMVYDDNIDGVLVKLKKPNAYYELGCDWMGQIGEGRRERFMVFSNGEGAVAPLLRLGYSAYMYHFADSYEVHGVVDNILVNPYARLVLGKRTGLQKLDVKLGWMQGFQNDRKNIGRYVFPGGCEMDIDVRNWNVGIRNTLFLGEDMMPLYNKKDAGGFKYGSDLYYGDPFYRVYDNGSKAFGTYDRLEAYYEPWIGSYLKVRVSAVFHFNNFKYSGCQQMFTLNFDLHELLRLKKKK